MYLKLSKASALYQQGKGVLLEAEELQKALDWKKLHKPTPAWGIQFNPAYERAMVFLNTSEEEYLWTEKRKIIQARRKKIVNRSIVFGTIVIAAAVALVIYISRNRPAETDQQIQPLVQEEIRTRPSTEERDPAGQQAIAEGAVEQARDNGESEAANLVSEELAPVDQEDDLTGSDDTASDETGAGETGAGETGAAESEAEETVTEPVVIQPDETTNVQTETVTALDRESEIIASIARDAAYMSLGISRDPDLQGLVAYQSYLLNLRHHGPAFEPDIYKGLYDALKKLISPAYNIYGSLRNSIKAMEWINGTGSILIASSDGTMKILSGNIANRNSQTALAGTGMNNECLGISPDERIAAVGTNGGGMLFIELENRGEVIHQNTEQGNVILSIENLGRSGSFLSIGTSNKILKWDYSSFAPETLVEMMTRPISLAISNNGTQAAIGTSNGRIYILNTNDPSSMLEANSFGGNQARALAFSPDRRYLAAGMRDGSVKVLSGNGRSTIANLFGPGARVSAIEFSPDGKFLAATSNDGNVYMWNALKWDEPPVTFTENNGFVLSLCFSRNGKYFYSGSVEYPRVVGRPTDSDEMASKFCSLLGRNLTREEWNQYFGEGIPYQETCPK